MEASVRIFNPLNLNRQISGTVVFTKSHNLRFYSPRKSPPLLLLHLRHSRKLSLLSLSISAISQNDNALLTPVHSSSLSCCSSPNSSSLGFLLSSSSSNSPPSPVDSQLDRLTDLNRSNTCFNHGGYVDYYSASKPINGDGVYVVVDRERIVTAVLLGWLGAKPKHLKRYAELYTSKGINAVTFVVPLRSVLWIDMGRNVENRVLELANQLVLWLMESEKDGRERSLVFHTFSNTGWLVYGAILNHLQDRPDVLEKIRGCIIDSGGAPELNPQVWAAGFGAALLKKRSQTAFSPAEPGDSGSDESMLQMQERGIIEALLLFVLEKIFSFLLKLPDINQRYSEVMLFLSKNQSCPQLYLYSTADKVIPYQSVELYMEEQRMRGRKVWSFNFETSPHVDHYRSFPYLYVSKVNSFLKECLSAVAIKQT
ncbi:hypothetical protein Ancab_025842 [Ancistrocladus abbreviatus]